VNSHKLKSSIVEELISSLKKVVGSNSVPLHEPSFDGNEWKYIKECLESTYVSSVGNFVTDFENALTKYTGSKYAVAVVNGTEALHVALKLIGVLPGEEVLVPALTFIGTANAVSYCGASPHFVDSEESTLGIDTQKLRVYLKKIAKKDSSNLVNKLTGRRIRALVPMHTFGHPSNLDELISLAEDFGISLVEDAAESLGSYYKGRHTGTFGIAGILSFNGNKTITTGGGGAILTSSETIAFRAKHITQTARLKHKWEFVHDEIGFNYRMPNLNAALGLAQIEQLPKKLEYKRRLYLNYKDALSTITGLSLFHEPTNCSSNYWLQTIILDDKYSSMRDDILEATNRIGISTRPAWKLINELPPYRDTPKMDLQCARSLASRIINIPSSPQLMEQKN
jgi:aminotransferase in exopolysaccharide biosynthesis